MTDTQDNIQTLETTEDDDDDVANEDKDQGLQQYLYAKPGPLTDLIEAVTDEVLWDERRTRKRKAKDLLTFRLVVEIVIANLVRVVLLQTEGRPLMVSRDTGGRQANDNPAIPRLTFVQTLDLLEASGFLHQTIGTRGPPGPRSPKRVQSTIEPTPKLAAFVSGFGVDLGCLRRGRNSPLIIVKRREATRPGEDPRRPMIGFPATPQTEALRTRIARLNDFLSEADLGFIPDGGVVDTEDRLLRRSFTVLPGQGIRFDQVGRLGGGFWQSLKRERRGNLLIQGEPIADLDFASMHPRITYRLLDWECPSGDLYGLAGILPGYSNTNPDHRDGVKRALCSLLNGGRAGRVAGLPPGTSPRVLRAALVQKHPDLVSIIESSAAPPEAPRLPPDLLDSLGPAPLGYRLMYLESEVLLAALDHLMALGVVALPSHDGLFVAQSNTGIAQEAMRSASKAVLGVSYQ